MRLLKAAAAAAALVAVPAILAAPPAQALTPQTVFGTLTCKKGPQNSAPTVAWVQSENGESGWAKISDAPGSTWLKTYRYTANDAGRFRLVVGCGGNDPQKKKGVVTAWMNPGRHNVTATFS
ncbi:hypothetical protein [Rhodococcus tukisamuensis]|uniref:Ig-like domain-containing protein n=1 Tax=Rhodococcus tukisamuensis TaxID=168276 RepID=A0A1G6SI84_9NOCA|nr:hypothetical protein [Rhodococcus tukisamuensis]SDD16660.1 hypothetical protein SAMN05444580_103155 [Rhodococcus tukisamuensis]